MNEWDKAYKDLKELLQHGRLLEDALADLGISHVRYYKYMPKEKRNRLGRLSQIRKDIIAGCRMKDIVRKGMYSNWRTMKADIPILFEMARSKRKRELLEERAKVAEVWANNKCFGITVANVARMTGKSVKFCGEVIKKYEGIGEKGCEGLISRV